MIPNKGPRVKIAKPKAKKRDIADVNREITQNRTNLDYVYKAGPKQDCSEENNQYDLAELYSSRAKYTAQQKLECVTAYVMTGTITGASRLTGLSTQLCSEWKNKATWWPDAYAAVKVQKQEEMDGVMTSIIHLAAEEVVDRLLNGDEVITKDGDLKRKKMSGKDVGWIMAVTQDKRGLLRGDPTSRTEKVDTAKMIEALANKFAEMGASRVVSEQ